MLSLRAGANRFEHLKVTRFDAVLGQIFGYERMVNYKALTRLLDRFDQTTIERVFPGFISICPSRFTDIDTGSGLPRSDTLRVSARCGARLQPEQAGSRQSPSPDGFCGGYTHACQCMVAPGQCPCSQQRHLLFTKQHPGPGTGQTGRTGASQRSRVCTEILNSRETVSSEALSGGSNRATALSLNACPYLANWIFQNHPRVQNLSRRQPF